MRDVRGIHGEYVYLNVDNVASKKVLVISTSDDYGADVALGVNEIDELIKNLQVAKEEIER